MLLLRRCILLVLRLLLHRRVHDRRVSRHGNCRLVQDVEVLDVRAAENDVIIHLVAMRDRRPARLATFRAEGANFAERRKHKPPRCHF